MLTKSVTSLAVLSSTAVNAYAPYGYHSVSFPEPAPILDADTYKGILSKFKGCKATNCVKQPDSYDDDISKNIATLGLYTSCVTGCVAEQVFEAMSDYKEALGDVFHIGTARLQQAREYISGASDYDVLAEATRIEDSCCLPKEYFTTWDQILIPANVIVFGEADSITHNLALTETEDSDSVVRMISVSTYLDMCIDDGTSEYVGEWRENLRIQCQSRWVEYLELLQHNIGSLIMHPSTKTLAPAGSCSKEEDTTSNPLAEAFSDDICVAVACNYKGKVVPLDMALTKPTIPARYSSEGCPSDKVRGKDDLGEVIELFEIQYIRKPQSSITFFTLTTGLPSSSGLQKMTVNEINDVVGKVPKNYENLKCEFNQGLAESVSGFYKKVAAPTAKAINAAKLCPYNGLFEYCNMQQYASYLQKQLFDSDACQIIDMRNDVADTPENMNTLACLYKTVSMKCDCMEAVLNCYEHQFNFNDAMAGTIGKAASVLCGFILCLRPKIYSLFGGQHAIQQANIMRDLLTQVGLSVPSASSMPPATFAFLAFGIGMVAFVATKIVSKKTRNVIAQDEGYAQLI